MGRYFNDDLIEDQNDDYDAYLEHFGIPKIKWNPQVRAKYDQIHDKTRNALRKAGHNIANNQTLTDFYSKAKSGYRSISDGTKKFGAKAQKQVNTTGRNIKKSFEKNTTYTTHEGQKIRGVRTPGGFVTVDTKAAKKSISDTGNKIKRTVRSVIPSKHKVTSRVASADERYSAYKKAVSKQDNKALKSLTKKSKTGTDFSKYDARDIHYAKKDGTPGESVHDRSRKKVQKATGYKTVRTMKGSTGEALANEHHNRNENGVSRGAMEQYRNRVGKANRIARERGLKGKERENYIISEAGKAMSDGFGYQLYGRGQDLSRRRRRK